ncbi:MAG: extracellular solute-binding protein [Puniceicoccaceae bacterium]|nr:MAG: extracellular solute-binding protein [Puniceicoccaceae bacterium]
MISDFPYGKAPFWILVAAILSGLVVWGASYLQTHEEPDLIFATFAQNHYEVYREVIPEFEKKHGVRVQLQLVSIRALQSRLQSALLAGTDVPDLVELVNPSMGYFTQGPLEDVGFIDLTDRIFAEGLDQRMVWERFSIWSSRERIFAIPHDVHPMGLVYRRDIVESLGIDVDAIETWDDFLEAAHIITRDLTGNGVIDRYALDLPSDGNWALRGLLMQQDIQMFDQQGRLTFNQPATIDTIIWYLRASRGPDRISFPAGWGQTFSRAFNDGLVVFVFTPDWRTRQYQMDLPGLHGKLAFMPLPAWEPGGRRTSVWGGTGLAITRQTARPELAWELAKFLYLDVETAGAFFLQSNIVPPFKEAWEEPEFDEPNPYYSNQRLGRILVDLARQAPPEYVTAYTELTHSKFSEVFLNAALHFDRRGETGLREYIQEELDKAQAYLERIMARNVFLFEPAQ